MFRFAQLLPGSGNLLLAGSIRADLAAFLAQVSSDPDFDYKALRLPIALADATAILGRCYQLDSDDWVRMPETPGSEARPYTETSALSDILEWSRARPDWLRDALRRLMVGGELSGQDMDELEAICLGAEGGASHLTNQHIVPQRLAGKPVAITGLRDPVGVNALASGQGLTFSARGLTIVYGDNGSGKSGFVRVFKSACRSRDDKTSILRDVNAANDVAQSAHIDFEVAGKAEAYDWQPEHGDHADLPAVSIFDARSANTHVQKTNNVAYVPFAMALLDRLGQACDGLRARVTARIDTLAGQTPVAIKTPSLNGSTAAGAFLHGLSAKSSPAELDLLVTLGDDEKSRLSSLDGDLAQDPAKAAEKLRARGAQLDSSLEALNRLVGAAVSGRFGELRRLESDAKGAAEAARLASDSLFGGAPLPGVGSDAWRRLWEAARAYSDEVAYPDRLFPASVDDERCVLCQQPLEDDARRRQSAFETFVRGAAQKATEDATRELASYRRDLSDARMPMGDIRAFVTLLKTELDRPGLASEVRRSALTAAWRLRALLSGAAEPVAQAPVPTEGLEALRKDIAERARALSSDADSAERQALVSEHGELKDRLSLAGIAEDVRAEIERQGEIAALKKAEKTCGTGTKRLITTKNKDLSEKLVTDALRGRFAREVEKLRIGSMPIELRKVRDRDFQSFFKVALVDKPDEPVGEILSEGEHRCVALAAFLAELVTSKDYSGIVFDDPMSSLDHRYRRRVAKRLVEEAAHRQVIVFTHDLTFLFDLQREAVAGGQDVHYQNVHRVQSRPGHVSDDLPIDAKAAWPMAEALRSELKTVRGAFDNWPEARRSVFADGVIGKLRKAWEQGIADLIQPVMSRFNSQIKGSSLHKLAIVNDDDVIAVRAARARLSEDLHASPETINPSETTHAELLEELKKLEDWLKDVKERQRTAPEPAVSYAMS